VELQHRSPTTTWAWGSGLKGDALAAVIGAKLKLFDLDGLTLSTRPALLLGGYDDEWSLPFTVEGKLNSYGFAWFGGAGLRHGMDDLGDTDPMVTGGIDCRWAIDWS
jgi:hypothetical protein